MKKKLLIGVCFITMVVSLVGCAGSKNKANSASTYFKALENTIKADNYQLDITTYESDVLEEYSSRMTKYEDGDKVYCGYTNYSSYNYFNCTYDTGTFYNNKDEKIDMTEEDNKYLDDHESETERYKIYKLFKTLENEDIDDVMENIAVFEQSPYIPPYRVQMQGIIEVVSKYLKDEDSVSFIKDLSMKDNEMKLTMYAADFYFWCDANIDSYTMLSEVREVLREEAFSSVLITIDIKLDGDFVSDYQYYLSLFGEEGKDGVTFKFESINKLDNKCILALYFKDREKYNQMRDEALKETLIKAVREISAESPEYRYKVSDDKSSLFYYGKNGGTGDYAIGVYDYILFGATGDKEYRNYAISYTTEEILDYLENGTELPEKTLSWQDIYIDYLMSSVNDKFNKNLYDLVDLTFDGIPELLVYNDKRLANELHIFTIDGEKVVELKCEKTLYMGLTIFEETGIIANTFIGDVAVTSYYKIDNSNINRLTWLTSDNTQGVPVYSIDNKEVSEEQYSNKKKELEGNSKGVTREDAKSAEDLIKELSGMK